jgi:Protein of unknown function (DUF2971)
MADANDQDVIAKAYGSLFEAAPVSTPLPLLAHYTSIKVMKSILRTGEVWFSNPLFMNDLQEVRFGLREGQRLFFNIELLRKAAGSEERVQLVGSAFTSFFGQYDTNDVFDTYVFCLSEHDKSNMDGLLSMWRGYGHHGDGVALVFDPSAVTVVPSSPLVISKVTYASDDDRVSQLEQRLQRWADLASQAELPNEKLFLAAYVALSVIKDFAITTKHIGFLEEAEWRVVYQPDRDRGGLLKDCLTYHIGERGVEPKLAFKVGHVPGVTADDLALERLVERIILGPSLSSPLARRSVARMLEKIEKPAFIQKLWASGIPLRPSKGGVF